LGREAALKPVTAFLLKERGDIMGLLRSPTRASPLATESPLATGNGLATKVFSSPFLKNIFSFP
jgi:hypothetical protein